MLFCNKTGASTHSLTAGELENVPCCLLKYEKIADIVVSYCDNTVRIKTTINCFPKLRIYKVRLMCHHQEKCQHAVPLHIVTKEALLIPMNEGWHVSTSYRALK